TAMSLFRFMRRDSPGMSCRGPRPGSIASAVTGRLRSPATSWPEWSPPSAMERRGCRWDSGCSATDWTRDGTLAEYVAVEARNLAPRPGDVDFRGGGALVMPALWLMMIKIVVPPPAGIGIALGILDGRIAAIERSGEIAPPRRLGSRTVGVLPRQRELQVLE